MATMSKHRTEIKEYNPRHRTEISNQRLAWALGGSAAIFAVGAFLTIQQPGEAPNSPASATEAQLPRCNINFEYDENVGAKNKRPDIVTKRLGLKATQLSQVDWLPAECTAQLKQSGFADGLVAPPQVFQPTSHNPGYADCVLYSTTQHILPVDGPYDSPAILACVRPLNLVQI